MFDIFFENSHGYKGIDGNELSLVEIKEGQKHKIIFNQKCNIEYFKAENLTNLKNIKGCDYIIINHTLKKILFCELKNAKNKNNSTIQLEHSQYILKCLQNVLGKTLRYRMGFVVFNKKSLKKGKSNKTIKLIGCKGFKYNYTGLSVVSFDKFNFK